MITFGEAKRIVENKWLKYDQQDASTPVIIADWRCAEYEWGWKIGWLPVEPNKARRPYSDINYCMPYVVDRADGYCSTGGGTFGIERGIIELIQHRPPELRGPYPQGHQDWLKVIHAFEYAGAFISFVKDCSKYEQVEARYYSTWLEARIRQLRTSDPSVVIDNIQAARECVRDRWQHLLTSKLGYEVDIDKNATEEFPWGWVFYFKPSDATNQDSSNSLRFVAFDPTLKLAFMGELGELPSALCVFQRLKADA